MTRPRHRKRTCDVVFSTGDECHREAIGFVRAGYPWPLTTVNWWYCAHHRTRLLRDLMALGMNVKA